MLSEDGEVVLIEKYQRRFPGFDHKILALYSRGMSTRDIQMHVGELYGVTISPDLVSSVTAAVMDEARRASATAGVDLCGGTIELERAVRT